MSRIKRIVYVVFVLRPFGRVIFDVSCTDHIVLFVPDNVVVKALLPDVLSRLPRHGTFAVPDNVPDRRDRAFGRS